MEKKINSEMIYHGRILDLTKDDVELDDHTKSIREIVWHHGGACIALKSKDNKFYMVKQYRYAHKEDMLEFCAGKLNEGEDPKEAIKRETREELGFEVKNLISLGNMVPTPGYSSEKIYLYYGEQGDYVGEMFDEDERIEQMSFSIEEIEEMIENGEITDGKTICIVYKMRRKGLIGDN